MQGQGTHHFVRISQGCLVGRNARILVAIGRGKSGALDGPGVFALGGRQWHR